MYGGNFLAAGADDPAGSVIHTTDTVTKMLPAHRGQVVVAGSQGGVYAGWCAANGGARAVILNDARVGKDQAGIASLPFLDAIGLAAATADLQSCRIADAVDMLATGVISAVNQTAAALDGAGVIAATVSADSARVGEARSCYQDGVLSHANGTAREKGARVGMTLCAFIDALRPR